MAATPTLIALIPARAGSKRVPGKNIRRLAGHPLIAYTISAAIQSQVFDAVLVSTDSPEVAAIARYYGAEVPFLRSPEYAADLSPDIEWLDEVLRRLKAAGRTYDCFSLLRPTSPFRQPETMQRAWAEFLAHQTWADSLRAIEKCKEHPGKMWVLDGDRLNPLLSGQEPSLATPAAQAKLQSLTSPLHSTPYQALPDVYIQNASLEIAWCRVVLDHYTIAGEAIAPFLTHDYEGLDINNEKDWWYVEYLLEQGKAQLPKVSQAPLELLRSD